MLNREEEEWLNSQLNPTEIVAKAARDTPKEVNSTSKITESKLEKKYSMGLVLTGKCIFLYDEIKNIMANEKSKMSKLSKFSRLLQKTLFYSSLLKIAPFCERDGEINSIPFKKNPNV